MTHVCARTEKWRLLWRHSHSVRPSVRSPACLPARLPSAEVNRRRFKRLFPKTPQSVHSRLNVRVQPLSLSPCSSHGHSLLSSCLVLSFFSSPFLSVSLTHSVFVSVPYTLSSICSSLRSGCLSFSLSLCRSLWLKL